jgi:hypothetical protein
MSFLVFNMISLFRFKKKASRSEIFLALVWKHLSPIKVMHKVLLYRCTK